MTYVNAIFQCHYYTMCISRTICYRLINLKYISMCKARSEADDRKWILANYSLQVSEMDGLAKSTASYGYLCQLTLSASSIMHH